ncbi:hypothetical protein NKH84_29450, partial [Mesorhizobium sp. M0902]
LDVIFHPVDQLRVFGLPFGDPLRQVAFDLGKVAPFVLNRLISATNSLGSTSGDTSLPTSNLALRFATMVFATYSSPLLMTTECTLPFRVSILATSALTRISTPCPRAQSAIARVIEPMPPTTWPLISSCSEWPWLPPCSASHAQPALLGPHQAAADGEGERRFHLAALEPPAQIVLRTSSEKINELVEVVTDIAVFPKELTRFKT